MVKFNLVTLMVMIHIRQKDNLDVVFESTCCAQFAQQVLFLALLMLLNVFEKHTICRRLGVFCVLLFYMKNLLDKTHWILIYSQRPKKATISAYRTIGSKNIYYLTTSIVLSTLRRWSGKCYNLLQ